MSNEKKKAAAAEGNGKLNDVNLALELFLIAGTLNATPDLDFLLEKIGRAAERLLDSEASAIMLVTDDKKNLYFRVAGGQAGAKIKTMLLPMGQGIAGWVAANLKPEMVNDCGKDPRFAGKFDKASGFVTRSLLCVPMLFQGELVGVVEVLNKRVGAYTAEDIGLLTSLSNLASVAITNTRVMQDQKNFISHMLELLASVIETSKPGMAEHPMHSARLACQLARALGLDDYEYRMIYYAGLLHDIGYLGLKNPRLITEMGIATPTEAHHPLVSCKMLDGIKILEGAIPIIKHHHESFDGTGFPGKLKGEAIPLGARILGLVEALEELRMAGLKDEELLRRAVAEAKAGRGTRFDPDVVDAAVELLGGAGGGLW